MSPGIEAPLLLSDGTDRTTAMVGLTPNFQTKISFLRSLRSWEYKHEGMRSE